MSFHPQFEKLAREVLPKRGLLIGDAWLEKGSGGDYGHVNASTGREQARLPLAGKEEIDQAVAAARAALPVWRAVPPPEKRRLLEAIADGILKYSDEFNKIAALEIGSPLGGGGSGSLAEVWTRYYAGWADRIEGQVIPTWSSMPGSGNALDYVLPEPYGVVGVVIPWNGAQVSISMKVIPALAAGNTVVLKPPELAPFSSLRYGELCREIGLPPGVLNIVPGGPEAGDALVRHPGVDKLTFTGGGATARKVMEAAAQNLKPLACELGGKSANLIFADADLDRAIPLSAQMGMVALSGQGCCLPTRMLVQNEIYDDVVARIQAMTPAFKLGNPLDASTVMGPVVSEVACDRIVGVIDRAVKEKSGKLLAGGQRAGGELADGFFIPATVFGDVENESHLAQEEIFGPVLSIVRFGTEEEGVAMANNNRYGLAAYLHTRDLSRAHRVARQLEAGYINVNGFTGMAPGAPFGGYKESGFGREGGKAGLEEFLQHKNVYLGL